MNCTMCRAFILDHLHHPLHPENRLTAIFHPSKLLPHRETLCFWVQRIQAKLSQSMLAKVKADTEIEFWANNQLQVQPEEWNKVFLKNLLETNPYVTKEFQDLQSTCEECGFLKELTEPFFVENYILPLVQTAIEIHSEHSPTKKESVLTLSTFMKRYTMKELREEYGNLYD